MYFILVCIYNQKFPLIMQHYVRERVVIQQKNLTMIYRPKLLSRFILNGLDLAKGQMIQTDGYKRVMLAHNTFNTKIRNI